MPDQDSLSAAMRKRLDEVLRTDADLDAFCIDRYPTVYLRFAGSMERKQKVNLLLTLVSDLDALSKALENRAATEADASPEKRQPRIQQLKCRLLDGFSGTRPLSNIQMLVAGGEGVSTNSRGLFVLPLPPSTVPGVRLQLEIETPGYCFLSPFNGHVTVPEDYGDRQPVDVRLLRSHSTQSNSEDGIARFIDAVASRARPPATLDEQPAPLDFPNELQVWASTQGVALTVEEAREVLSRWLREVHLRPEDDAHTQGLALYLEKQFTQARRLFLRVAEEEKAQAEQDAKKLAQRRQRIAHNYRLAGDASREELDFAAALDAYQQAEAHLSPATQPEDWAMVQVLLGIAHQELGIRVEPGNAQTHLSKAVEAYRQALKIRTQDKLPQAFATTQNNLGNALLRQGERASGGDSERLLSQAVEAFRQALKIYTQDKLPQAFAGTQNNLGIALRAQGERASGGDSERLLSQAVEAFRQALKIRTQDKLPQDFAMTQNNLGTALAAQGERASGGDSERLLSQAVEAYRQALKIFTQDKLPQDFAMTQNNLGIALAAQGKRASGGDSERLLAQSVEAFRQALQVYSGDQKTWNKAFSLCQERLFDFAQAYELLEKWLARHPDDAGNLVNFAEAHFTTGRFTEAARQTATLLARTDLDLNNVLGLHTVGLLIQSALKQNKDLLVAIKALRAFVAALPSAFERTYGFAGVKAFIKKDERVATQRAWMLNLIAAVETKDRAASLAALDALAQQTPPQ